MDTPPLTLDMCLDMRIFLLCNTGLCLIYSPRNGICNNINDLQTWRPGCIRLY
jgi:hypothetical protein